MEKRAEQITPEELKEHFMSASDDIQEVLASDKLSEIVESIGDEHGLTEAGMEELQDIIAFIILELTPRSYLEKELRIFEFSDQELTGLIKALDNQIFNPLRRDPSSLKDADFLEQSSGQSDQEESLDRDALLAEIEDTPEEDTGEKPDAEPPEQQDFIGKKMSSGGSLPRTESQFEEDAGEREEKEEEDNQDPAGRSGYDVDPYREPIG